MGAFDDVPPITIPDPTDAVGAELFRRKWNWEPHEQVLLKGNVTVADQEYVSNKYMKSGKKGDMEMQAGTGRYALLDRMILDWSLMRNGTRVLVTPQSIRQLPANYSNPILERLDDLAAAMTEEEQEDFLDSASGHTEINSELVRLHL
jgi:hypothetical protein